MEFLGWSQPAASVKIYSLPSISTSADEPTAHQIYLGKKTREFRKVNLESTMLQQLFREHLHGIRYRDDLKYTGGCA